MIFLTILMLLCAGFNATQLIKTENEIEESKIQGRLHFCLLAGLLFGLIDKINEVEDKIDVLIHCQVLENSCYENKKDQ